MSFRILHGVHGPSEKDLMNELRSFYILSILSAHIRQLKSKTVWELFQSMFFIPESLNTADIFRGTSEFRGIVDSSLELLHSIESFYFEILTF